MRAECEIMNAYLKHSSSLNNNSRLQIFTVSKINSSNNYFTIDGNIIFVLILYMSFYKTDWNYNKEEIDAKIQEVRDGIEKLDIGIQEVRDEQQEIKNGIQEARDEQQEIKNGIQEVRDGIQEVKDEQR